MPVGASLLANVAGQLALINLTHPLREQARSHKGIAVKRYSMISAESSVGASLLAMRPAFSMPVYQPASRIRFTPTTVAYSPCKLPRDMACTSAAEWALPK